MNQSCSDDCKEMKIADGMCLQCPKRKKHTDDNPSDLPTPVLLGLAAASGVTPDKKAVDKEPETYEAYDVQEGTELLDAIFDTLDDRPTEV